MSASQNVTYQTLVGQISAMNEFTFPAQYLANQRYSYNQHLSFDLGTGLRKIVFLTFFSRYRLISVLLKKEEKFILIDYFRF